MPISLALLLVCCSYVVEKGPARATSESPSGSQAIAWNLTIDVDGERFSALLDDTTLPGSGLSELASALSPLLNRTLSTK